jgi:hypothetical protein
MRQHTKLLLAAMTATALMALAVGSASAGRLSVDEQNFRITWTSLEFVNASLGVRILCPTTLEGSFHSRTIVKVARSLIGYVTSAGFNESACRNGSMTVDRTSLPWHVSYETFSGTLPNITRIQVLLRNFTGRLRIGVVQCTLRTGNIKFELETGVREGENWKPDNLIPGTEEAQCGEIPVVFSGTGRVTRLNATTRILLRLI